MAETTDEASIAAFTRGVEEEHRLRGYRSACGFVTATWGLKCPRCGDGLVPTVLADHGTVATFTVQTVPSDEFLNDAPYAYVVVDLAGGGRVSGWMASVRSDADLAIGDPVHLVASYRPGVQFAKGPPGAPTGG